MKGILLVLVGLTFVVSVGARAEETVKEAVKPYTPRAGLWEFELDGPAFPVGQINFYGPVGAGVPIGTLGLATQPQRGANISYTSSSASGAETLSTTSFGLTGSIGYCATDLLEVGLGLGLNTTSLPSALGGSATAFNARPFLKFNLGASLAPDSRVNPFLLAGAAINFVTANSGSGSSSTNNTFVIPELAVGVEAMVTRWWGISFFVPFTMAFDVTSGAQNDVKVIGVGFGYGVAAYFD